MENDNCNTHIRPIVFVFFFQVVVRHLHSHQKCSQLKKFLQQQHRDEGDVVDKLSVYRLGWALFVFFYDSVD
jgi:hypothetical protein